MVVPRRLVHDIDAFVLRLAAQRVDVEQHRIVRLVGALRRTRVLGGSSEGVALASLAATAFGAMAARTVRRHGRRRLGSGRADLRRAGEGGRRSVVLLQTRLTPLFFADRATGGVAQLVALLQTGLVWAPGGEGRLADGKRAAVEGLDAARFARDGRRDAL